MSDKLIRRIHPALRDDIGDLITQRRCPHATWTRSIPSCS
jgi:hypothetical protein